MGPMRGATGPDREALIDALELELRQLDGVTFVAFGERDGATLVELAAGASSGPAAEVLRSDALRVALAHVEGPVVVEIYDGSPGAPVGRTSENRVQLLLTLPVDDSGAVEVHLARLDRRASAHAEGGHPAAVAEAVLVALGRLGLRVPFSLVGVHDLAPEMGAGTLVVLRDDLSGELRRGLAAGRTTAECAARAVLNALNRYLQSATVA